MWKMVITYTLNPSIWVRYAERILRGDAVLLDLWDRYSVSTRLFYLEVFGVFFRGQPCSKALYYYNPITLDRILISHQAKMAKADRCRRNIGCQVEEKDHIDRRICVCIAQLAAYCAVL